MERTKKPTAAMWIAPGKDQPAITPWPRAGKPVGPDEFSFEFEVEADRDGLYVIDVRLMQEVPGGVDRPILLNRDALVPTQRLLAGARRRFRVVAAAPVSVGRPVPPAATESAHDLPPLEGTWPAERSFRLYYDIAVRFVAPVPTAAADHATPLVAQRSLLGRARDMRLQGTPVEFVMSGCQPIAFAPCQFAASRESVTVARGNIEIELRPARHEGTLFLPAVEATVYVRAHGERRRTVMLTLQRTTATLSELGQGLLEFEAAMSSRKLSPSLAWSAARIVRHGRVTIFGKDGATSGWFVNDRLGALEAAPGRTFSAQLADEAEEWLPGDEFGTFDGNRDDTDEYEWETPVYVWMTDECYVYLVAWILAGTNYEDDISEVINDVLQPAIDSGECIPVLEILSHGGPLAPPAQGSRIKMGSDYISSTDFDASGACTNSTTQNFLDKVKQALCGGGRLIFSACGQNASLIRNISRYLDKDIIVIGNSGTGIPTVNGDLRYQNGDEKLPGITNPVPGG